MDLFLEIEEKWIVIDELTYEKIDKPILEKDNIKNLEEFFPEEITLTKTEKERLRNLESKKGWYGEEFLEMRMLQQKRGIHELNFLKIQKSLFKIHLEFKMKGIELPVWFNRFFSNKKYLSRFRFGDISFQLWQGIMNHPRNPDWYLIPLLGDSQGYAWWGLIINEKGESIVTYQDTYWGEVPEEKEFRCSDSIEEFLFRMSRDMIKKEKTATNNVSLQLKVNDKKKSKH
jgi:hypothetical protein